jgi:hypothetical protein
MLTCDVRLGFLSPIFSYRANKKFGGLNLSLSHLKRFLGVLAYSLIILACVFISHETKEKQGIADSPGFGLNQQLNLPFNPSLQSLDPNASALTEIKAGQSETSIQPQKMASGSKQPPLEQKSSKSAAQSSRQPSTGIPVLMGQSPSVFPTGLGQSQL